MKRKFSKILGVSLTVALLASLVLAAAPVAAVVSEPRVTASPNIVSNAGGYSIVFDSYIPLSAGTATIVGGGGTIGSAAGDAWVFVSADTISATAGPYTVTKNGVAVTLPLTGVGTLAVVPGDTIVFPSTPATDTIKFTTGASPAVHINGDSIYVQFPADTTLPLHFVGEVGGTPDVTLAGSVATTANVGAVTVDAASRTVRLFVASANIGTADHLTIVFSATTANTVTNPPMAGSYTLWVKTSKETIAVESKTYTIAVPISRYNKYGNFVSSYTSIQAALTTAGQYDRIVVGAGTYTQAITGPTTTYVTLESTEGAIIVGNVASTQAFTTIDGFTIKGATALSGINCTIKNCNFTRYLPSVPGLTLLTGSAASLVVDTCEFDTTSGSMQDTCLVLAGGTNDAAVIDCSFNTDSGTGAVTAEDTAISVTGAVTGLMVKGCTFSGTKGTGFVEASGSTATIKDSTFDGYAKAISITAGVPTLNISGNTIKNSSFASAGAIALSGLTGTPSIVITGNTIEDNVGYSVDLKAAAGFVTVINNNLVGNTKGLRNTTTTALNAIHNWWGDASGPTVATNPAGTGDIVSTFINYNPWRGVSSVSMGDIAVNAASLDAQDVAGVVVSGSFTANPDVMWVAAYEANPEAEIPEYSALTNGYFDVYMGAGPAAGDVATIKLYARDINKSTDAYYWSAGAGKWLECDDQGVSAAEDYVWVRVTFTSSPAFADLIGTPFALVAGPVELPGITLTAPTPGRTVPVVTNVGFTWSSIVGATKYELVLSANTDLSSPIAEETVTSTAYTYTGTLTDEASYYWQVTALKGSIVKAKSDIATFTVQVPVETVTPQVTVEAPDVTVEAPAPVTEAPPTPGYIWAIIAIGALLVVAVLVLIVRTRRAV